MIKNQIDIELAYINTHHPDFIGGRKAATQASRRPIDDDTTRGVTNAPLTTLVLCIISYVICICI
jgi:hypothetical protein